MQFRPTAVALAALALCLAADARALVPPASPAADKAYRDPSLYVPPSLVAIDDLPAAAAGGVEADLAALGIGRDTAFFDLRAGRLSSFILSVPLIPGAGAGNTLQWPAAAPLGDTAIGEAAGAALLDYLARNTAALRIDLEQVGPLGITVHGDGALVQIWAPRVVDGIRVRDSVLSAVLNHGNLVLLGFDHWGPVMPASALIGADQARAVVAQHAQPLVLADKPAREARLEYVPTAKGEAYDFRLAWFVPVSVEGDMGTWEGVVDAATGTLLAFEDRNQYAARRIVGGVFPVSNDGAPPDGIEQAGWPMPYTDIVTAAGTITANSAGVIGCGTGSFSTTLTGRYTRILDACGAINETSAAGDLDLGASAGTNCTVPAGHSAGDTHAARTGMYELTRLNEHARSYLPNNAWLNSPLTSNMNINLNCNAFWNGVTVNFYREGSGCGNTGEIAAIFDHEWGHGIDNNHGNTAISSPGEAIADIHAFLRLNTSCIGRGFIIGGNCGGYGDPCTSCSGVRDIDFARHASGAPHTLAFAQACSASGSRGPCNRETHCEGMVPAEAGFDLVRRDLVAAPFNLDLNTALELGARLFFAGAGPVTNWYQCTAGTAGCPATSGYMNLLAADDDNGNLLDGTPHMTAIFAAFNRHGIACNTPTVQNAGCAGGPTTAPTLSATAQDQRVSLSWTAAPNTVRYDVFQTEGVNGAAFGKVKIGSVPVGTTTFVAENLQNGRVYHFNVLPVGSTDTCIGRMSNSVTTTPVAGANLGVQPTVAVTVLGGDSDGILDNCEVARLAVTVENTGTGALTNVRIVGVTPLTHPSSVVLTPLPSTVAASLSECALASGTVDVRALGMTFDQTTQFRVDLTADQLGGQMRSVIATVSGVESDWQLTPTQTFSFETDGNLEGWQVQQGTWTQATTNGGANGTLRYVRSSSAADNACDVIRSPRLKLRPNSTLSLSTFFTIENISGGVWYDRANVGIVDLPAGTRRVVSPSSGRLYNASGGSGGCAGIEPGWAGTAASWAASNWSSAALSPGTGVVQLEVRYATDFTLSLNGFRYDEVTLANFDRQVPDAQPDTCCAPLTVNPATIPAGTVGAAYSQTFTQTGGTGAITWSVTGALPTGVTLNPGTGVLSGTPTQSGSFPITITATDAGNCTGSRAYTLVINCPPITVGPATIPAGTVGTAYSQAFTQMGGNGTITWSVTGALPTGVTLNPATGVLSGTPTQTGSFPITIRATDATGCFGTRAVTLVINCQTITVNPGAIGLITVGVPFSQTFTQIGGIGTVTWAITGTVPPGLTFNSSTGVLSGTPTALGAYSFSVTATDANGCTGTRPYAVTVICQTVVVMPPSIPPGTAGTPYSTPFSANTVGAVTWSVTGTLPAGLTLNPTTGVLSGTPTQTGNFPITVSVTDSNNCTGSRPYTLVINCQTITVDPGTIPPRTAGSFFSQAFTQTGGIGTITWSVTGTLPPGVTLNTATGALFGTPTQTGSFPITLRATDANGCIGTRAVTLVINCQTIIINPSTIPAGTAGAAYSQTFTQTFGLGIVTWSVTGTLPTGMTLNASSGVLSGTPTQTGVFPITVITTDANGCTGSRAYTLVINCQTLTVNPATIPAGTAGTAYSQTFTQAAGIGAITWSVTGALPSGLALNPSTGVLSGTPTQTGSFPITVTATDANGCAGNRAYTLVIDRAGPFVPTALVVDNPGNRVFEPGETVDVAPAWRNDTGAPETVVGAASSFTGPAGATYTLVDGTAGYGAVPPGATATCATGGDCYQVSVSSPPSRPILHWDSTMVETLSSTDTRTWTLHVGQTFTDVPPASGFYRFVETLVHRNVTGGCGPTTYCPASSTSREQMAVFVLVSREPPGYLPPPCGATPMFPDVPVTSGFCRWVEELARRGVVGGCGGGNYCPSSSATREQMAVFVLRALDPGLNPPPCGTPMFADVPASSGFCRWIEELARRGVVGGCGGGNYCPVGAVTREQMSVFLVLTFGLTLYGL